jgi:RNA polymerase sigma factor (sigma-70 family)
MQDKEIIQLILQANTQERGFRVLVEKFQRKVYWHIRKMVLNHDDANDITQDTFVKIWQNLPNYRGDSQLFTWIYRIATNECLNFLNKKNKKNEIDIDTEAYQLAETDEEPLVNAEIISQKLEEALAILPDKQRLVFNMKYFDELKYEEISDITGTSVGALKASYHLAVKKIEEFLTKH